MPLYDAGQYSATINELSSTDNIKHQTQHQSIARAPRDDPKFQSTHSFFGAILRDCMIRAVKKRPVCVGWRPATLYKPYDQGNAASNVTLMQRAMIGAGRVSTFYLHGAYS